MPETKILPVQTAVTIIGSNISIRSYYVEEELPVNTLLAFISDDVQTIDGTSFIEGELGVQMQNYPEEIDYTIDSDGDLVVIASDAENYSINSSGELIYTY